jgi:hypothetical protein
MRGDNREIGFMEERGPNRHSRVKGVGREHHRFGIDRPHFARLELGREHDVEIRVSRSGANSTPQRGIDVTQQRPCILVNPQIQGNIESTFADLAKAVDVLDRISRPVQRVLRKIVIGPNLVGYSKVSGGRGIP